MEKNKISDEIYQGLIWMAIILALVFAMVGYIRTSRIDARMDDLIRAARLEKGWVRIYVGDPAGIDSIVVYQKEVK